MLKACVLNVAVLLEQVTLFGTVAFRYHSMVELGGKV